MEYNRNKCSIWLRCVTLVAAITGPSWRTGAGVGVGEIVTRGPVEAGVAATFIQVWGKMNQVLIYFLNKDTANIQQDFNCYKTFNLVPIHLKKQKQKTLGS